MGISPFSNSKFDIYSDKQNNKNVNPDPSKYEIIDYVEDNSHLLILIKYHGCTNYEGLKLLLFRNCTLEQLKQQKDIDPHFSNNKTKISPFARFEPTMHGVAAAKQLIELL